MSDQEFEYLYNKYDKSPTTKEEIKAFLRFCEQELSKNFSCFKEISGFNKCNSQCAACYSTELF